jgi:predicted dehydrogenase
MSEPLSFGVVGLGFGAVHARALSGLDGIRLAAVCDRDEQRLTTVAGTTDATPYSHHETMLRSERLDAVIVAVPARLHADVALAAIEAGAAVLVEKPLAPSWEEGQKLVLAASRAGVPLMAGHIERFNPAVCEVARRVQAGEIGHVLQMSARRMAPIGVRTQDVNIVHDSALHDIDVMRFVLGAEVESAFAAAQTGILHPFEDSISGLLRFTGTSGRPGPIGSLEVNWLSPRRVRDLTVLGEEGLFVLDYTAQTLDFYPPAQSAARQATTPRWSAPASRPSAAAISIPIEPKEPLAEELAAFVSALRTGREMPVTGADALAALAIADALTRSSRVGRPLTPARE